MSSILRNIINDIEKGMADTTAEDIERHAWEKGREINHSTCEKMAKIERYTWKKALQIVRKWLPEEQIATSGNPTYIKDNQSFFNQIIKNRIEQIQFTLNIKAKEYASKADRFHNFRVAARKMNTTPEVALQGMMAKHEVAVLDMIKTPESVTIRMIDEKIGDHINYLILLEGLLKERISHD